MHRAESVLQNCVMGRCAICIFIYCYNQQAAFATVMQAVHDESYTQMLFFLNAVMEKHF